MQSYYNSAPQGQMKSIITRPNVGLNEFTPEIAISDNHMSDMLDADVYRDEALVLSSVDALATGLFDGETNTDGIVLDVTAIQGKGYMNATEYISDTGYLALVVNKSTSAWFLRRLNYVNSQSKDIGSYPLIGYGLPKSNLIKYSNFSDGFIATTWTAVSATHSEATGNCVFTATVQGGGIKTTVPCTSGRKYFVSSKFTNPSSDEANFYYTNGTNGGSTQTTNIITYEPGMVFTATATGTLTIGVRNAKASAWSPITVYYINAVDITEETMSDNDAESFYLAQGNIPYMLPVFDEDYKEPILSSTNTKSYSQFYYGSCSFNTGSFDFVCFTCSYAKILIHFNTKTNIVDKVDLPFYPKKIVSHLNRIFAIDTENKIWWCRAADFYSWYSSEYDDTMLSASQNMKATAYTLSGTIDTPRPVTATITVVGNADTYGSMVVTGTNALDEVQTETIPLFPGRNQGLKTFKTVDATGIITSGWVTAGTADTIEFGVAPVGGYVQADAGVAPFEKEKTLTDLCVMGNNLYVFAPDNIYIFRGDSPLSFLISTFVANIGIKDSLNPRKWLTTINNISYFYSNGDIYQFDGNSYPRLITHPEQSNGSSSNSMFGGIESVPVTHSLASDNNHLYVYNSSVARQNGNAYYLFDTQSKSWWKNSGFNDTVVSTDVTKMFRVFYITMNSTDDVISLVSKNTTAGIFDMYYQKGHKGLYTPFIVTKAYNTNPSELGTLTAIILQVKGTTTETSTITLSYSLSASANDFKTFKVFANYKFNGDIENLDIPVPVACIANAHHYRIKIECTGYTEIYNIERRFRTRGRTR